MTTTERQQRALSRASIYGGAKLAEPLGDDHYRVCGRRGDCYTVRVFGDKYSCDCDAGLNGVACWHQAATYLRRLADLNTIVKEPAGAPASRLPRGGTCAICGDNERAHRLWGTDDGHLFAAVA